MNKNIRESDLTWMGTIKLRKGIGSIVSMKDERNPMRKEYFFKAKDFKGELLFCLCNHNMNDHEKNDPEKANKATLLICSKKEPHYSKTKYDENFKAAEVDTTLATIETFLVASAEYAGIDTSLPITIKDSHVNPKLVELLKTCKSGYVIN